MPEYSKQASLISTDVETIDWLTKDYLENVLRKYKKDNNLKILNIDLTPATSKGENYASVLTRLKIKFQCNDNDEIQIGNYIIKTSFEDDEFAKEKMLEYDIYNREMEIYEKIIPKMNEILEELQQSDYNGNSDDENDYIDGKDKLFAETIFVDYENSAIIFEDLSARSFILVDRLIGLDITHVKIALRKLAKMHAASAVLNERESNLLEKYNRGMFNRHTEAFSPFFVNTLDVCGQFVSEWNEFKTYGEKILKLKPFLMEYGKRVFDAKENHFNAFIHGDFWTNNIMFRYDDKDRQEPKDAVMIDFQFSCWTSPTVDLHYFFNTSMREELRLHHQDELVQYYYKILTRTLKALNYKGKIPSLHEFWIQFMEKSFYAFTSACIVQPVMLNTETADADFHGLMDENERAMNFKRTLFKNERVQKNLKRLLPMFDRKGLIDIQNH